MIYTRTASSIYFLTILICFNLIGSGVNLNLYSEFNNELNEMSNYAENKVSKAVAPYQREIYDQSGQLILDELEEFKKENLRNADKLDEIMGIRKLINVLSPYHEPLQGTDIREQALGNSRVQSPGNVGGGQLDYGAIARYGGWSTMSQDKWRRKLKKSPNNFSQNVDYATVGDTYGIRRRSRQTGVGLPGMDTKMLLNSAPSLFPSVIAKLPNMGAMASHQITVPQMSEGSSNLIAPKSNPDNSGLPDSISKLQRSLQDYRSPPPVQQAPTTCQCPIPYRVPASSVATANYPRPYEYPSLAPRQNPEEVALVLEKVLEDLDSIKQSKLGGRNSTPDGTPCDLTGSWNSEVMGLKFTFNVGENKMDVDIKERIPPKPHSLIDLSWTCTGNAMKKLGGPFYITAEKSGELILATFAGLCKRCGGVDLIFGSWNIIQPAKDCQDLMMAMETRRDVFHRDALQAKKDRRLAALNKTKKCKSPSVP